jgi:hypothetical protein
MPDGILRCRKCGEERLITLHEGFKVVYVYCEVCAKTSLYPKPEVDVPVSGNQDRTPGAGWGV